MVIQIKINPELIEWVCRQTGMDFAEAEEFVKHFVGMLYLTGAFFETIENEPAPASSAGERGASPAVPARGEK